MPIKSDTRPNPRPACAKPEAQRFSHLLAVATVPDTGLDVKICASEAERGVLAARCGILSVQSFEAGFHVRRQGGRERFHVSGNLQARMTQMCVVSLEPFESEISADIDAEFALPSRPPLELAATHGDLPDPIIDGQIDLGALAAEFLVLNLNLYPRKPGAVFDATDAGENAEEKDSPFAVLLRR